MPILQQIPEQLEGRRLTFAGGVHPPGHKEISSHLAIERAPLPPVVMLPLAMHVGGIAKSNGVGQPIPLRVSIVGVRRVPCNGRSVAVVTTFNVLIGLHAEAPNIRATIGRVAIGGDCERTPDVGLDQHSV